MSAAMTPTDHVFIEALTALSMTVVRDSRDEEMLIGCAIEVEPRVNLSIDPLCRVVRAFSAWRAARATRSRPYGETLDLSEALRQFHRWRLGAAQAAMKTQGGS